LREFTVGHPRLLESVLGGHLAALCERLQLLPGADARAFGDIDSLLRPVDGHAKQVASHGHTKSAGKQILRKGPIPAGDHDQHRTRGAGGRRRPFTRGPRANSGKGAGPHDRRTGARFSPVVARSVAAAITTSTSGPAPTQLLALGQSLVHTVAQHHSVDRGPYITRTS
jgi:hypothetical protein